MCGNGIRCVGKYLYDSRNLKKKVMTIETKSGLKQLKLITKNNEGMRVSVNMGRAELNPARVPVLLVGDKILNQPTRVAGGTWPITCVSMGNPHCVVFRDDVDGLDLESIGPRFETDPIFPERVNTEFVKVIDEHTVKMRVWERGSGETLACGTGACAAVVAAVENGFCPKGEDVRVILLGGELTVNYTDERVTMTGNAEKVFEGTVEF
jgi:carbamoyl-phosphate synthase large subunit